MRKRRPEPIAEDEALARYQGCLLRLAAEEKDPARLKQRLLEHPDCAPFRDYVETFEPKLLATAVWLHDYWKMESAYPGEGDWVAPVQKL